MPVITKKLHELADVFSGYAFKSKDLGQEGIPVVKIKNVNNKVVSPECDQLLPSNLVTDRLRKYLLKKEDILVAMTGQGSLGRIGKMINPKGQYIVNQRVGIVRPDEENEAVADYLFSVLALDEYEKQLYSLGAGAGQPNVSAVDIGNLDIPYPEKSIRDWIANTRKNYDKLIENNNRRIAILEDMAQSLYREWFVNFRYPNHDDSLDVDGKPKLIDSPLGQIPEGWEVKRLDEIADVNPQSITKKNAPEEIGYIDIKSVGTGTINDVKAMSFDDAPSRARRVVVDGDIIWATVRPNRKQFSYICKPAPNTIASTGFAVLRSKNLPASYLYSFTTTDSFTGYLVNHATGSAYPAVNTDIFQKADILVPPKKLMEKFDELCADAISQSEVLKKKNKNLKQQRDMLLPQLISGKIKL